MENSAGSWVEESPTYFEVLGTRTQFDHPPAALMSNNDGFLGLEVVTAAILPQMDVRPTDATLGDGHYNLCFTKAHN